MKYLRWLLLPFSLLYGLVVIIRNWFYDAGMLKSHAFNIPVICVGNLDIGGAGKSPMTEYLIRLLKDENKLATLSRGYGRNTRGYLIAATTASATEFGDEPAQFKQKFPDVTVAVCESRVPGIQHLKADHDLVILDDGYQHRAVKPGFSILLFDYTRLDEPHFVLPAGNLREPFSGRWRADVLVVSKCPESLAENDYQLATDKLQPLPFQNVFFTSISYQGLHNRDGSRSAFKLTEDTTVFLLTGIANPAPLLQHLKTFTSIIHHHNYPDHHPYSLKNISKLALEFRNATAQKKVIITTEKDAQRLERPELQEILQSLPVLVLPIVIRFHGNSGEQFDELVTTYVRTHRANHVIH